LIELVFKLVVVIFESLIGVPCLLELLKKGAQWCGIARENFRQVHVEALYKFRSNVCNLLSSMLQADTMLLGYDSS